MKERLTEWFPANIRPVYPGVYEILVAPCLGRGYRFWDGSSWHAPAFDLVSKPSENTRARAAAKVQKIEQMCDKWRGLAKPYKGWKP